MASANHAQTASETQQAPGTRTDMSSHFTRSVSSVRKYTSQFEDQVARPALGVATDLFSERPLLATFLATLLSLSFLPVLTFLVVSALTVVTLVSSALILSLSAASLAVLLFFGILVSTVIGSGFIAAIITILVLGSYLVLRLLFLAQRDGLGDGITLWAGEIWIYFVDVLESFRKTFSQSTLQGDDNDHDIHSETTNEYAVIGHEHDEAPADGKIEESSSEEVIKIQGN